MKKFGYILVILSLTVMMAGCGPAKVRRNNSQQNVAFTRCDLLPQQGGMGNYDVWVVELDAFQGLYQLVVIPIDVVAGEYIRIGIVAADPNTGDVFTFREVVTFTAVQPQLEIAVTVTEADLLNHNILAIRPANGLDFLDPRLPGTSCELPLPPSLGGIGGNI